MQLTLDVLFFGLLGFLLFCFVVFGQPQISSSVNWSKLAICLNAEKGLQRVLANIVVVIYSGGGLLIAGDACRTTHWPLPHWQRIWPC